MTATRSIEFATHLPHAGYLATPESVTRFVRAAESLGFTTVKCGEHLVFPKSPQSPYPYAADGVHPFPSKRRLDLFVVMSWVAAHTTTLRMQSGVCILPLRSPLEIAKMTQSLDCLSGGRFTLEVGLGWMRDEYDILNVPYEERGARADEALQILRVLFEGDGPFKGRFYEFPELWFEPKPQQHPFPIHIGCGTSDSALRRVAPIREGVVSGVDHFRR